MKKEMTYAEKHKQINKEAKITFFVFLFTFFWWVVTGWGLSDVKIYFFRLPLWWWLSCIGLYIISCGACIWLVKYVFVDFDLGEDDDKIESIVEDVNGGAN